jgi:hypothetical protein
MEFTRDAVTPWAQRLKQEGDFKLFPTRGPNRQTDIDTARLSQGDFKTRMEAYQVGRRMGVYSANDILKKEGENAIGPEGDVRIVESNMTPMAKLLDTSKKPEIFAYHIQGGIPTINEVRARLGLPPREGGDELTGQTGAPSSQPALPPGESAGAAEDGAPLEDDTEDVPGKDAAMNSRRLVRAAVVTLFASSIERYVKRLSSREADLRRRALPEARVEQNLATERARLRPWLIDECRNALDLVEKVSGSSALGENGIIDAADEVDNGVDPREAAERLVTRFMEEV